jgi:hypothetical protein
MPHLNEILEQLHLDLKVEGDLLQEVKGCYISDLLSDVMAHANEGDLWVTLQTHPNIVAVAAVKGLCGIILTNNRSPEAETSRKAEAEKVTIMVSPQTTFEVAGQLYELLRNGRRSP